MLDLPKEADNALFKFFKDNAMINDEQLRRAITQSKITSHGIAQTLLEMGFINEGVLASKMATSLGLQTATIKPNPTNDASLKSKINNNFIAQKRVLPHALENNSVSIAIADPYGFSNISQIKRLLPNFTLKVFVTTLSDIDSHISKLGSPEEAHIPSPKEAVMQELAKEFGSDEGIDIIDFVNNIIENAVSLGVSDIHIETFKNFSRLRYRRDGTMKEVEEYKNFLNESYSAVTTRIKIMSSLDISERRLPQDGGISVNLNGEDIDIRVSILPTAFGERVVMRVMDKKSLNMPINELGFSDTTFPLVDKYINSPQGLILVTGPTGSGKSTTLYAILNELNKSDINILTAEDPVEYNVEGIGQVHVKEAIGLSFSAALRSFLRQDPEIIMVGEIRDKETVDISVKAALTGHLVLSTLHTNDAPSTVTRLLNMGVPSYLLTSSLSLVVAQRLARTICSECKVEDNSHSREKLMALGFREEELSSVTTYKGSGCHQCMDTGAKGRRAIHEVLAITNNIKQSILQGANDLEIKKAAKQEGFMTMQDVGKKMIMDGVISVEEFQRVLVLED